MTPSELQLMVSPCNGFKCPSAKYCQRYTDWATYHGTPAAFWARREDDALTCDCFVQVPVIHVCEEQ